MIEGFLGRRARFPYCNAKIEGFLGETGHFPYCNAKIEGFLGENGNNSLIVTPKSLWGLPALFLLYKSSIFVVQCKGPTFNTNTNTKFWELFRGK
jgi:hypothetical protein